MFPTSSSLVGFRFDEFAECIWIFRAVAPNSDTVYRFGITGDVSLSLPPHGLYLERLAADTNWFFVSRNYAVQTRIDSGIAFATSWINVRTRRVSAGEVRFSLNGSAETAVTTNIPDPADGMVFANQIIPSSTIARIVDIDFFSAALLPVIR